MAVDDIVGVRIVGRYQDQNIVSTLHYQITAQTDPEHLILTTLVDAVKAQLFDELQDNVDAAFLWVGIRGFSVTGNNKQPGIEDINQFGTLTTNPSPAYIARTITLYTDSDNYRRRGRFMLSGCQPTMFDATDNSVTPAARASLSTLATALTQTIISSDEAFQPVLPPSGILPVENITSSLARKTPALIRSRRIKGMLIG